MHHPRKLSTHVESSQLFHRGKDAADAGQFHSAVELLTQAISLNPCAKYHANLAVALERVAVEAETDETARKDLLEQAVVSCLAALRTRPDYLPCIANLTLILERLGRVREAAYFASLATSLSPRSGEAAWIRAGLLVRQQEWIEAAWWYAQARRLKPSLRMAVHNEVSCLTNCARDAEALYLLHGDLRRNPREALTWVNLGCVYRRLGRNQIALECYDRAIELQPNTATAAWGRSLCLLALGRMAEGWEAYEWGLETGDRQPPRPFTHPRWEGQAIGNAGGRVLVWMEQGPGDHIVWASLLQSLEDATGGARMVVECEHRLLPLFQRSFPMVEFLPQSDPPHPNTMTADIVCQIPAGSLPGLLRPNLGSYRREKSRYLVPAQPRANEWRSRLDSLGPGPKVGICWRSLRYQGVRAIDCTKLSQWGPILSVPGISWINLQPGWRQEELDGAGERFDAKLHTWSDLDLKDDQDELAALISSLDLVVSAFTITAQMTGALGVPCWVLSHQGSLSWWTLGTSHCPWHPSIRFFQCQCLEPWEIAIGELARELHGMIHGSPSRLSTGSTK
jgi:tetratricopeptide (TPR) repeat protein